MKALLGGVDSFISYRTLAVILHRIPNYCWVDGQRVKRAVCLEPNAFSRVIMCSNLNANEHLICVAYSMPTLANVAAWELFLRSRFYEVVSHGLQAHIMRYESVR